MLLFDGTSERKELLLPATKLIEKIPDAANAKNIQDSKLCLHKNRLLQNISKVISGNKIG